MNTMNSTDGNALPVLQTAGGQLAVAGMAETASWAFVRSQVLATSSEAIEMIRRECGGATYWPEFCMLARGGKVPADWLPGALGSVVLRWAKEEVR